MIPELTEHGLLPPGVHDCDLSEIEEAYVYNEKRRTIWNGFDVYKNQLLALAPEVDVIYVDGSFTTDRTEPGDVDIAVEVETPLVEASIRARLGQMVNRAFVKGGFQTDLLWAHRRNRGAGEDIRDFFQKLKAKDAIALGLPPATRKGLLRVRLR